MARTKTKTETTTKKTTTKKTRSGQKNQKTEQLDAAPGVFNVRCKDMNVRKGYKIFDGTIVETIEGDPRKGDVSLFMTGKMKDGELFDKWAPQFMFAEALGYSKPWDMFPDEGDEGEDFPDKGAIVQVTVEETDRVSKKTGQPYCDIVKVELIAEAE